ncbi:MAG: restriction endonuclease [Anaerolineae bacterium]|nr:restriction endonuclease [Anaerolineae bacterium]
MPKLTIKSLCKEALIFSEIESRHAEPLLYGITDGKAVGTYLEQKFRGYLSDRYQFNLGNSAIGIDFPQLNVDIKVTSINQPQSSCPFKSARQKIYGLGYSLLIFIYQKFDNTTNGTSTLNILHTIFVNKDQTADFQTTSGILSILANKGNKDDIMAFLYERNLPVDEIGIEKLAAEIIENPPKQGYLTISNALQWRLQYRRVIAYAGKENGVISIHQTN